MRKANFEGILSGVREAIAHAKREANDLTIHELPELDVAAIRAKTKLSQGEFARAFGVALGTLIDHDPVSVVNTLTVARMAVKVGAKRPAAVVRRRPRVVRQQRVG